MIKKDAALHLTRGACRKITKMTFLDRLICVGAKPFVGYFKDRKKNVISIVLSVKGIDLRKFLLKVLLGTSAYENPETTLIEDIFGILKEGPTRFLSILCIIDCRAKAFPLPTLVWESKEFMGESQKFSNFRSF